MIAKTMKRVVCVFLSCLLLSLPLFVPAAAEGDDPNAPIFTQQPPKSKYIQTGKELKLSARAKLPNDVEGELNYIWYLGEGSAAVPVAVGQDAVIPIPAEQNFPLFSGEFVFYVVAIHTYMDGSQERVSTTESTPTKVTIYLPFSKAFLNIGDMILKTVGIREWIYEPPELTLDLSGLEDKIEQLFRDEGLKAIFVAPLLALVGGILTAVFAGFAMAIAGALQRIVYVLLLPGLLIYPIWLPFLYAYYGIASLF